MCVHITSFLKDMKMNFNLINLSSSLNDMLDIIDFSLIEYIGKYIVGIF